MTYEVERRLQEIAYELERGRLSRTTAAADIRRILAGVGTVYPRID